MQVSQLELLQFNLLRILIKVFLVQFVSPVLKSLPYNRWNCKVVISAATSHNLWNEVISPTSLITSTLLPAIDLPSVIFRAPTLIKSAIPKIIITSILIIITFWAYYMYVNCRKCHHFGATPTLSHSLWMRNITYLTCIHSLDDN